MKIAFPTQFDHGLESPVFGHFGSAGYFLVVDDASGAVETIVNADRDHLHGQCQPLAALGGNKVDADASRSAALKNLGISRYSCDFTPCRSGVSTTKITN
jgi:hypothetical protein